MLKENNVDKTVATLVPWTKECCTEKHWRIITLTVCLEVCLFRQVHCPVTVAKVRSELLAEEDQQAQWADGDEKNLNRAAQLDL